jgi:hypothetical protein
MILTARSVALFFLISLLGSVAIAAQIPTDVRSAAHCLAIGKQDWLDLEANKPTTVHLSYSIDLKSYPGQSEIYVITYSRKDRSRGMVFTVFHDLKSKAQTFDIQNNATFVRNSSGIDFPGPPLGGIWTQQHLMEAIQNAGKRPSVPFTTGELRAPSSVHCTSYVEHTQTTHP